MRAFVVFEAHRVLTMVVVMVCRPQGWPGWVMIGRHLV